MTTAQQLSVVVIDDDPLSATMVAAALAEDWSVQLFSDGASGLQACASAAVGAVVLDLHMPGMDGWEVCRRLRGDAATADLPVIFLSGASGQEARLACYAAGGDDFLSKPLDAQELRRKVAREVAVYQRMRALAGQVDELMQAVMSAADIAGDAGLVLDFQRRAAECDTEQGVARLLLDVLAGLGLEACLGPRAGDGFEPLNTRGEGSALELAILAQLGASDTAPSPQGIGPHTGWRSQRLLLFVRDLVLDRPPTMAREHADRMGRHIDTISMLLQGADRQLLAIEAQRSRSQLAGSRQIVRLVRQTLVDIAERGQAQRQTVRQVFERLTQTVEDKFISLGLTQAQEDYLSDVIQRHHREVQAIMEDGRDVERQLSDAIGQLGQAT